MGLNDVHTAWHIQFTAAYLNPKYLQLSVAFKKSSFILTTLHLCHCQLVWSWFLLHLMEFSLTLRWSKHHCLGAARVRHGEELGNLNLMCTRTAPCLLQQAFPEQVFVNLLLYYQAISLLSFKHSLSSAILICCILLSSLLISRNRNHFTLELGHVEQVLKGQFLKQAQRT